MSEQIGGSGRVALLPNFLPTAIWVERERERERGQADQIKYQIILMTEVDRWALLISLTGLIAAVAVFVSIYVVCRVDSL